MPKGVYVRTEEGNKHISEAKKGSIPWNKNISHSAKSKQLISIRTKEGMIKVKDYLSSIRKNRKLTPIWKKRISDGVKKVCTEEFRSRARNRMLNGGASYCNSFVKNPSKPQVKLYEVIRSWFPQARLNYPHIITNKSLDIAIPNLKIWFEYDGSYWHQDKEKDLERQKLIEDQGWRCIRYRDKVPTEEEFIQDVRRLL